MSNKKFQTYICSLFSGLVAVSPVAHAADSYFYKKSVKTLVVTSPEAGGSSSGGGTAPGGTTGSTSVGLLSTSVSLLNFGTVSVGSSSSAQAIRFVNAGTASLTVQSINLTGDFQYTGECGTLAAGEYCDLSVSFKPTASGTRTGTITLTSTGGSASASLSGVGSAPISYQDSSSYSGATALSGIFGSSVVGTPVYKTYYVITQGTTGQLTSSFEVTNTTGSSFTVETVGKINTSGATAACGTAVSCVADTVTGDKPNTYVVVKFLPIGAQSYTGSLKFTNNGVVTDTLSLTGTGTGSAVLESSVGANTVTFPDTFIGSTSASQSVRFLNSGNIPLTVGAIQLTGDYTYNTTCPSLEAGATCDVYLSFAPTARGTRTGVLTMNSTGGNVTVNLSGVGQSPLTTSISDSYSTQVAPSTTYTASVTVPTYKTYYVLTSGDSGTLSSDFHLTGTGFTISAVGKISTTGVSATCGGTIDGSAVNATSCVADALGGAKPNTYVTVKFAPTALQSYAGTFSFNNNGSTSSINLSGTGANNTVTDYGTYKAWSDGTFAQSCNYYKNSSISGYAYGGATGNGVYRIQPAGQAATDVYCDMTTYSAADGSIGGWTLVATISNASTVIPNGSQIGTAPRSSDSTGVNKFADSFIAAIPSIEGLMIAKTYLAQTSYNTMNWRYSKSGGGFKGWNANNFYTGSQSVAPSCWNASGARWYDGRLFHIADCYSAGTPMGYDGILFRTAAGGARFTHSPGAYVGSVWVK